MSVDKEALDLHNLGRQWRELQEQNTRLRAELADLQKSYDMLTRDFAVAIESDSKHIAELAECREELRNRVCGECRGDCHDCMASKGEGE